MRRRALTIVVIAALPVVVAALLAGTLLKGSLLDSVPYVSDEIAYWTQIAAFSEVGFGGGYTTLDEHPARATFTHFGPEGPGFPVVYGLLASAVGWRYASGPIFGAVVFLIGACIWLATARPPLPRAALVLGTFWPVILAAPNTMQESLHFAIACVLAALMSATLGTASPSRGRIAGTWTVIAFAGLIRPTWALIAIPFAWQRARQRGARLGIWGAAAGIVICLGLYGAVVYLSAPYSRATTGLDLLTRGFAKGAIELATSLTDWRRFLLGDAEPLERFFRVEVLAVALLATASAWRSEGEGARRSMAAMAGSMWVITAANLALENVGSWQDYRAAAPILLMTVLAATATRAWWPWAVVVAHLLIAPLGFETFRDFHSTRWEHGDRAGAIDRFAETIRPYMRFDPALSGWGNTLLVSVPRYDYTLMGVPAGIGLSVTFDWEQVPTPAKSRYILLGSNEIATGTARFHLRKLTDTPLGVLYENEDWTRAAP